MEEVDQSVAVLDDVGLADLLIDLEKQRNAVEAAQAIVMLEMHRRAERREAARDAALTPIHSDVTDARGRLCEFVADEIAVLLTCTRVGASRRLHLAREACRYRSLMMRWQRGSIDARKVMVIAEALADGDPAWAESLADAACTYAETHTASQLRPWLARRVVARDPQAAEVRRRRAVEGRRVTLSPRFDGVTELMALLPSIQARQIYDTVTAIAQSAGSDDARTMDQRRADALVDLLVGRAEPPQVALQVLVPADTLLGEGCEPGWIPGVGPATPAEVEELIDLPGGRPTWRRLVTDPETGILTDVAEQSYRPSRRLDRAVRARDVTCRFPGCRRPGAATGTGTDLDHVIPWPAGSTEARNLVVLCRHHHRVKHSPGWAAELSPDGTMVWTTPSGRRVTTHPWAYYDPPAA